MPRRIHRTANFESRRTEFDENGVPLSLKITSGRPYSRKCRSKIGHVSSKDVFGRASQPRTYLLNESSTVSG